MLTRHFFSQVKKLTAYFLVASFMLLASMPSVLASELSRLVAAEYYIDRIPGLGSGKYLELDPNTQFNSAYIIEKIRPDELSVGIHTLSIRFKNEDDIWSPAIHQSFYWPGYNGPIGLNSHLNPIIKGEVFFNDQALEAGTGIELTLASDGFVDTGFERLQRIAGIRGLTPGAHSIHIRLLDSSGTWSAPLSQTFYVYGNGQPSDQTNIIHDNTYAGVNNNQGWFFPSRINNVVAAEAFYNGDQSTAVDITLPAQEPFHLGSALAIFEQAASAGDIPLGVNSIHVRFKDNLGEWSQAISQTILTNPTHNSTIGNLGNRIVASRYSLNEQTSVSLSALDGAFDEALELTETQTPLTTEYQHAKVSFLDLSGYWSDPLNSVIEPIENDADGNGLPDQWEQAWFGQTGIDANADSDGDGVSNIDEFLSGTNPLIPNSQTGLTISGYVTTQDGVGIPHVVVCLNAEINCTSRTDQFGHYVLGLGDGLGATQHTVSVKASSASGVYAFSSAQTVVLNQESAQRINFESIPIQLEWSFVPNQRYSHNETLTFDWTSNVNSNVDIIVELIKDNVEETPTEPNGISWYRFTPFAESNGIIELNIPDTLATGSNWLMSMHIANAEETKLRSPIFEIGAAVPDVPIIDIDTMEVTRPTEDELFTAELVNLDESKTITRVHWSAVKIVDGEESAERILLGDENTLQTDSFDAGDWRLYAQAQDDTGQWSQAISKDIYVSAIDGLSDLAITQTSVEILDDEGNVTFSVEPGQSIKAQVTVENAGSVATPEHARVIVKEGFGEDAYVLGTADIMQLSAGAQSTVSIELIAPNQPGYQNLSIDVQFVSNLAPDLTQAVVAESNRFNNATSTFLIVGNPPPGSFGIEAQTASVYTVYPGQSRFISGKANYSFGSRIPVMGTQVYVELEDEQFVGRTTSPTGQFSVAVKAPLATGDYLAYITVNGGLIPPARKQVVLRVIPWPTPQAWNGCSACIYVPPLPPAPVTDLVIDRLNLTGEGQYMRDDNGLSLVQNTDAGIVARVYNNGNLAVNSPFKVSFFYQDQSQSESFIPLGEPVEVASRLGVNEHLSVTAAENFSVQNLGESKVYAFITELDGEDYIENNARDLHFDVRESRPDLRGNFDKTIRLSNSRPVEGEQVRLFADITNRGPAELNDSFSVRFYEGDVANNNLIDTARFSGSLEKWQSTTLEVYWTPINPGINTIVAVIDEANEIDEDTESNNTIASTINVQADIADLHVGLALSDYSVMPGASIILNASLTNRGTQTSDSSNVSFYLASDNSNQLIEIVSVEQLESNASTQLSSQLYVNLPHGTHRICAQIDINERSHCRILNVSDLPSPDLQVYSEDITYIPGPTPALNDELLVMAQISNVSAYRAAREVTVQFFADSPAGFIEIGQPIIIDEIGISDSVEVTSSDTLRIDEAYYVLQVRVYPSAADGDANFGDNEATTAFAVEGFTPVNTQLPSDFPTNIVLNEVQDLSPETSVYRYSVTLSSALPDGYGVFLNFDDQQGNWFAQSDLGGHIQMSKDNEVNYSLDYQMQKPGLRSFRAGVFDLQDITDPNDDVLVLGYTDFQTCTLNSCKDSIEALVTHTNIGNPVFSNSGSQLFKNVDIASGNYHYSMSDLSVNSVGPNFSLTRVYNSLADVPWSFSYDMSVTLEGEFNRRLVIGPREDGRMQHFFKDMDQKWYALNPGNFDQVVEEGGELVLYTKGNRLYRFPMPNAEQTTTQLRSVEDRLGNALSFNYVEGLLSTALDASGNTMTFAYDEQQRLIRVSDFTGRFVEYSYNEAGMLSSFKNIEGNSVYYAYESAHSNPKLMTSMTDPRGIVQVKMTYNSSDKITELREGTETVNQIKTQFSYARSSNETYTAIIQPEIDGVNHNIVYFLDTDGTRVLESVDAENYDDFLASRTNAAVTYNSSSNAYKPLASRNRLAEQSLVNTQVDLNGTVSTLKYSDDGKGNPTETTVTGTASTSVASGMFGAQADTILSNESRTTLTTYAEESAIDSQQNLTPVTSITLPSEPGREISTQYQDFTATGKSSTVIDPRGNATQFSYESDFNLLKSVRNARGFSTSFEAHDRNGNLQKIVDANDNVTTKTYDQLSRLMEEVSPLGLRTIYTYYESNLVKTKTVKEAEGFNNDGSGDIDYTYSYFYDASNNLTKEIDPKGHHTNYVYDDLNRLIEKNYIVGNDVYRYKTEYDQLGRIVKTINPRGNSFSTIYTARNQVDKKLNGLDVATLTYTYDKNGNVKTVTDAEGRTTTNEYDAFNRRIKRENDLGKTELWHYNKAGFISEYKDRRGYWTYYEHDLAGNVIKVTDATGGVTHSSYDNNNNLVRVEGPNGQITEYVYDKLDRPISTKIIQNNEIDLWQYVYDANGNVVTELMPNGETITRQFDALNRVIQKSELDQDSRLVRQVEYTYDANSNIKTQSDGVDTITYTYDEINRLSSVTDQFGQVIKYGYDKAGNRTYLTYPGNKQIRYTFDDADRLIAVADWLGNTTTYTLNDAGQVEDVLNGNGSYTDYEYDDAGRITLLQNLRADGGIISRHQLELDGNGNIKKSIANLPLQPELPANFTAEYDSSNRIIKAGSRTFEHDTNGRIIEQNQSGDKTEYQFDVNDQLTAITDGTNYQSTYLYDLNNNRIAKTDYVNGVGEQTRYVIDRLANLPNVVAETDSSGNISNYYVYGYGLLSKIDNANNSHYYHFNPTGHTIALTENNGFVSDNYAYTPYGKTNRIGDTHNPFLFVGKYGVMDDGNGLHYMRARYYKEDIKRFMSLDALHGEILTPQSLNRYAYVLGNPIMGIDPSGLKPLTAAEQQEKIRLLRARIRIENAKKALGDKYKPRKVKSSLAMPYDSLEASLPKDANGVVSSGYTYAKSGKAGIVKGVVTNTICNQTLDILLGVYEGQRYEDNVSNAQETCSIVSDASNPGYVLFTYGNHVEKIYSNGFIGAGEHELSVRLDEWNKSVVGSGAFIKFIDNSPGNELVKEQAKQNAAAGIAYGFVARGVSLISNINPAN